MTILDVVLPEPELAVPDAADFFVESNPLGKASGFGVLQWVINHITKESPISFVITFLLTSYYFS